MTGKPSSPDRSAWAAFPPLPEQHPEDMRVALEYALLRAKLHSAAQAVILTRVLTVTTVLGTAFLGCEIAAVFFHAGPLWWWTR